MQIFVSIALVANDSADVKRQWAEQAVSIGIGTKSEAGASFHRLRLLYRAYLHMGFRDDLAGAGIYGRIRSQTKGQLELFPCIFARGLDHKHRHSGQQLTVKKQICSGKGQRLIAQQSESSESVAVLGFDIPSSNDQGALDQHVGAEFRIVKLTRLVPVGFKLSHGTIRISQRFSAGAVFW